MNNHINASPFAAGLSVAVNERLAQVQAILSLNTLRNPTAYAAALAIVDDTVSSIVFAYGDFIGRDAAAAANSSLSKAKALIELASADEADDEADEARELVTAAAGDFIRQAMESLESEAQS